MVDSTLLSGTDSGIKGFTNGTHRLVSPDVTLERLRPWLKEAGITRVANITGLDRLGIPVALVVRPNSRSLAVSQGKGITLAAAKASALMESIETYHAERIQLPLRLASHDELREDGSVIDVTELPHLERSAYSTSMLMLWIAAFDLLRNRPTWVPYDVVHTNYTLEAEGLPGAYSFLRSSNGLASGNHVLEAITHGICELVERDALTLWRLLPPEAQARRRIDLATVSDPHCRELIGRVEAAGLLATVWETTMDIAIPSFGCTVTEREPDSWRGTLAASGFGCHPSRQVAFLRALAEAAQCRVTLISGARDDISRADYERFHRLHPAQRSSSMLNSTGQGRPFEAGPGWQSATFLEDVQHELEILRSAGLREVAVVDLSRSGWGVTVVRVIIPGLEMGAVPGVLPGRRARQLMARAQA
jgi:ribosomal protein S12 methylthiotransferase accessory factor